MQVTLTVGYYHSLTVQLLIWHGLNDEIEQNIINHSMHTFFTTHVHFTRDNIIRQQNII